MNTEHPITPPLSLINHWWDEAKQNAKYDEPIGPLVAIRAAQWGADQELEACCEWLVKGAWFSPDGNCLKGLRADRRPQPPSLKEQALSLVPESGGISMRRSYSPNELLTIRRALEALPDD